MSKKSLTSGSKRRAAAAAVVAAVYAVGTTAIAQQGVGGAVRGADTLAADQTAQDAAGQGNANQPGQSRFDLPAGSLADVLAIYCRQTGVTVNLGVANAQLEDFRTHALRGVYANEQALRLLLEGTGLSESFTSSTSAVLSLRASEHVEVRSALPDGVSMTKFTQPLEDTPQTIVAVPKFVIQDEGVSTLENTLRNVPGISLAAGEAGAQGDNLTIRGFTARNDIFLDGIRDFGSYYRDAFNYEQVDVLEGPAGVAFGRGSTGGVINQESKVPQANAHTEVDSQFGTNLQRRLTVDTNMPLENIGSGTAARFTAMVDESGVAGRPFAELRRFGLAPSITFGLNSPTRYTLNYFHLTESDTPDYGLPWFYNQLAPGVSRSAYFGFGDENDLKTNDDILTAQVTHDFNSHVTLHSIARAANYPRQAQITEPQICSNAGASVPVGGYISALPTSSVTGLTCPYSLANYNPASVLVNRNQIQVKSVEGDLWEQTELTLHFKTFGIRHELTGGAEGGQEISNPIRYSYTLKGAGASIATNTVPYTTLLNPNTSQVFGGTGYISSIVHTKAESVGVYFVDTLHLGRHFDLSGGVRYDRFDTGYNLYQPTPPSGATVTAAVAPISRVDEQPTYRAAFVYKPSGKGSVYFDYGTSFDPAAESLSLSIGLVNGSVVPEENESYEAGAKWNFMNERLMVEGAVFRTEKDNARETDPTNSLNIVNAGNQVVKGVQVSAVGRLPQGMDVVLGYAYLDSFVSLSKFYPTSIGFQLANVPRQTFNAFLTHQLPGRFMAGFGGNYVASRTASSTVPYVPLTFGPAQAFAAGAAPCGATATTCYQVTSVGMKQVPGYWVFNAMLRRPLTDHVEMQANVNNLLNRFFIDLPHPSHLIPGEGVNALIGLNFKF
jgi:catecholate siderophore receptor